MSETMADSSHFVTQHADVVMVILTILVAVVVWFIKKDVKIITQDVEWLKKNAVTVKGCHELRNQCIGRECIDTLAIKLEGVILALQKIALYADTIPKDKKAEIMEALHSPNYKKSIVVETDA